MFLFAAALALQSPTYRVLSTEAQRDSVGASRVEGVKADAAPAYTGEKPLPFHVELVSPVELIDPVTGRRSPQGSGPNVPPPVPPAVPAKPPVLRPSTPAGPEPRVGAPEPAGDERPTYHFEGKRPFGGLTVYTPVRDRAGRNNSTRASGGGGGLLGMLKWIGLAIVAIVVLALLL